MGERKKTLRLLHEPATGFLEAPNGAWTWTCAQRPLSSPVEAPSGSAMTLSRIMGLPFIRLRCALPDELFGLATVGQALGRREGLSLQGMTDARDDNIAAMMELARFMACCGAGARAAEKIPGFAEADEEASVEKKAAAAVLSSSSRAFTMRQVAMDQRDGADDDIIGDAAQVERNRMVGTALVFAFMANAKTLPVLELATRQAAAWAHFRGVAAPGISHGFDALVSMFTVMLSGGNLSSRNDWLEKAKLWRLVLLQDADGGWDLTESLALALEAHDGKRPPRTARKPSMLSTLLGALVAEDEDLDDAMDDAIEEAMASSDDSEAEDAKAAAAPSGRRASDCPLLFSRSAVRQRLPAPLAAVNARYERHQAAAKERAVRAALVKLEHRLELCGGNSCGIAPTPAPSLGQANTAQPRPLSAAASFARNSGMSAKGLGRGDGASALLYGDRPPSLRVTIRPRRMRRVAVARAPVERIWSTVLVLNVLEEMDSCWLVEDEPDAWRTVVDAGREYLEAQAREHRAVRKLLADGTLQKAAERARKDWRAIMEAKIAAVRDADVINRFTALTHLQRASARVVRSMMTDHSACCVHFLPA